MHIFRHIFLSNSWWQRSDIWSQASYRYPISWEAFLDPSDSYFLFADSVDFYTHWTYMLIFRRIFLSNYWWQKSDIWSQASYRYPISWEVCFDPSDSYFRFAEERGYHRWAVAHSSSCYFYFQTRTVLLPLNQQHCDLPLADFSLYVKQCMRNKESSKVWNKAVDEAANFYLVFFIQIMLTTRRHTE